MRFKGKGLYLQAMKKGRNKELIKLRDEALYRRYYYWTEVQRLRFDDALRLLSEREFFIRVSSSVFLFLVSKTM